MAYTLGSARANMWAVRGQLGMGKAFFTSGGGDNSNSGLTPAEPLRTITAALTKCTSYNRDHIFVLDHWNEDGGTITVNVHGVSIIGFGNGNPIAWFVATGDTDCFNITGYYVEIANIAIGGGSTASGILLSNSTGAYIHDCQFGMADLGDTPANGIEYAVGHINAYIRIANNMFIGNANSSGGKLTAYGIFSTSTNEDRMNRVDNNIFSNIPTKAIYYYNMHGGFILNNTIMCDADTAGAAITLDSSTRGNWVDGNHANFLYDGAMTTNPFVDNAANDYNSWGLNYKGSTSIYPAA